MKEISSGIDRAWLSITYQAIRSRGKILIPQSGWIQMQSPPVGDVLLGLGPRSRKSFSASALSNVVGPKEPTKRSLGIIDLGCSASTETASEIATKL